MTDMEKKAADLLKEGAATIKALEDENVALKAKVAGFERREKAAGLAKRMEQKKLIPEGEVEKQAGALASSSEDLDALDRMIDRMPVQGGFFGVGDAPQGGGEARGRARFDSFLNHGSAQQQ